MTDNGDAYIMMLKHMQTSPTIIDLFLVVWAKVRTRTARAAMKIISISTINITLTLFFLSA